MTFKKRLGGGGGGGGGGAKSEQAKPWLATVWVPLKPWPHGVLGLLR